MHSAIKTLTKPNTNALQIDVNLELTASANIPMSLAIGTKILVNTELQILVRQLRNTIAVHK